MKTRTILAIAFGSLLILPLPSAVFAQATGNDSGSVVTAPNHDHSAAPADTPASRSCCAKMPQHDSHQEAPAPASADHQHDAPAPEAAKPAGEGCCSGMMKGRQEPPADQSAESPKHSCCCGGMKM